MINYSEGQILGDNNIKFIQRCLEKTSKASFLCHCGNEFTTMIKDVKSNKSKSCGCLNNFKNKNKVRGSRTSHGLCKTKEYVAWQAMQERCYNPRNPRYSCYGHRGITVCPSWIGSFESFIEDMGFAPSKEYSLDRVDNDGNYCKENCRWATKREQFENRSATRFITLGSRTLSVKSWSELTGISLGCLKNRLNRGWPVDKALNYYKD
jgi:hypothetical protein